MAKKKVTVSQTTPVKRSIQESTKHDNAAGGRATKSVPKKVLVPKPSKKSGND